MRKLFLLAVSLAALWGCSKSDIMPNSPEEAPVTKATNVTGYVDIRFSSGTMQANITFSPGIPAYFLVYFNVNKIYVQGSYTYANVETICHNGFGNNYSEVIPATRAEYSYVDMSSFSLSSYGDYRINWVVSGLPTYDPEPSGPSYCSGCGHIEGQCPSSCSCGCQGPPVNYCPGGCGHVEGSCPPGCGCGCDSMFRSVPMLK